MLGMPWMQHFCMAWAGTMLVLAATVQWHTLHMCKHSCSSWGSFDDLSAVWLLMPLPACHCMLTCGLAFQVLSDLSHTQQISDWLSEAHLPWAAFSLRYDCSWTEASVMMGSTSRQQKVALMTLSLSLRCCRELLSWLWAFLHAAAGQCGLLHPTFAAAGQRRLKISDHCRDGKQQLYQSKNKWLQGWLTKALTLTWSFWDGIRHLKASCKSGIWRPIIIWRCKYNTRRPYEKQWSHITTQEDAVTTQEEQGFFPYEWKKHPKARPCMNVMNAMNGNPPVGSKLTIQHSEAHSSAACQPSVPAHSHSLIWSKPHDSPMTAPWQPRQPHHTAAMLLLLNLSLPL